ncbi:hypothetical protein ACHAPT_001491 [Fusarium lateritium]
MSEIPASTRQALPNPAELPLGDFGASDFENAQRICGFLERHGQSMPDRLYNNIIHFLETGYYRHNSGSVVDPRHHHIYSAMYDSLTQEVNLVGLTYANWLFLASIYGPKHGRLAKFGYELRMKFGWDLTADVSFHQDIFWRNLPKYDGYLGLRELLLHRHHHGEV